MSYYGTKMSQLYTAYEGFTTTQKGYPVWVHTVTGSVTVKGIEMEIGDDVDSAGKYYPLVKEVANAIQTDTGKDIRISPSTAKINNSKKDDYTRITDESITGTDYRNFIVSDKKDEPGYHIYILPILVGDQINTYSMSVPKNEAYRSVYELNTTDNHFFVGIKTNTGGDRGVDVLESIYKHIIELITKREELEFTEPFVDTTTTTTTTTNTDTNTNAYVHDTGFTNEQFKELLNNTPFSGHTIVSTPTEVPTETPTQTPSNQPIESPTETSNQSTDQSTEQSSNSNIADILSNLPSEITINHNVVYTKKKSDSDDYDSTSMSDNPYYGYMPNVQTSNPDALKSIGSKFFTGIIQSMFT